MPRGVPYTLEFLKELHASMLKAQREGGDFDMTYVELTEVWGVRSYNTVAHRLRAMQKHGLVRAKKTGRGSHVFRAVRTIA